MGSTVQPLQCAIGDVDSFWVSNADILSDVGLDPSSAVMVGTDGYTDFQSWPTQDLAAFRMPDRTVADFSALAALVQAQMVQLTADSAALLPQETTRR